MTFDQPPLEPVRFTNGREGFRLEAPWSYTWSIPPGLEAGALERQLRIPGGARGTGFLFDGASVPRLLWTCTGITPAGLISAAALIHDALYRRRGQLPYGWLYERPAGVQGWCAVDVRKARYTRKTADKLFARIMREAGVARAQRRRAYWGVRVAGWWAWRRRAPRLVEI